MTVHDLLQNQPHYSAGCECPVCGYEHAAVWPVSSDKPALSLECPSCHKNIPLLAMLCDRGEAIGLPGDDIHVRQLIAAYKMEARRK